MASNVVFFEYYSASYTSFMSVVKVASPFASVEDLYHKTSYKLGSLKGTSFKTQFNVRELFQALLTKFFLRLEVNFIRKLPKRDGLMLMIMRLPLIKWRMKSLLSLMLPKLCTEGMGRVAE